MKGIGVHGRWARWEGMTWPIPDIGTKDDTDSLEWKLRYAHKSITQTDLLVAASYLNAYGCLVAATAKMREEVVRTLKWAQDHRATQSTTEPKDAK